MCSPQTGLQETASLGHWSSRQPGNGFWRYDPTPATFLWRPLADYDDTPRLVS